MATSKGAFNWDWVQGTVDDALAYVRDKDLIETLGEAVQDQQDERNQTTDTNPPGTQPQSYNPAQAGFAGFSVQQIFGLALVGGLLFFGIELADDD